MKERSSWWCKRCGKCFAHQKHGNRTGTGYSTTNNRLLSDGTYIYAYGNEGNRTAQWVASGANETR